MTYEIQTSPSTFIDTRLRRRIAIHGVEFDETFIADLISKHMRESSRTSRPTITTAFEIKVVEI